MQTSGSASGPSGGQEIFDRLLAALHNDRDRAGEIYESLRRRMLTYFRMHGFPDAHDLFDETMERAARRLSETQVANVTAYIAGIARLVCFEEERKHRREVALDRIPEPPQPVNPEGRDPKQLERALECLKWVLPSWRRKIEASFSATTPIRRVRKWRRGKPWQLPCERRVAPFE